MHHSKKIGLTYNSLIKRLKNIDDVQMVMIGTLKNEYPIYMLSYGKGDKRVALSAGIHGDELSGVEALLCFLEGGLDTVNGGIRKWEKDFQFTLFPCTNPTGYERGTRENMMGVDLNRRFGSKDPPEEVSIVESVLRGMRFDLYMDFHEDIDGEGFYLYEVVRKGEDYLAEMIIQKISRRYSIDLRKHIDGFPNCGGIICPQKAGKIFRIRRDNLPLPLYLYINGTRHCLTMESPYQFSLEERVGMHLMALDTALSKFSSL